MRQRAKVDVIIPVYKPDDKFTRLVQRLQKQTFRPNRIIVVNTERKYWDMAGPAEVAGLEVHHISKEEFDHGGTRNRAAGCSQAEIMIFMTDDAVPKDRYLVERLVEALSGKGPEGEVVAMAYARQLPGKGCKPVVFQLSGKQPGENEKGYTPPGDQGLFRLECLLCVSERHFRKARGLYWPDNF